MHDPTEADKAARLELHKQLRSLQGRINHATNTARALTERANTKAKTDEHKAQLLEQAKTWANRAQVAQLERDELKAKHFGSAHPRFHLEPIQRKKAATEARMAQRRKDHGFE